MSREAKSHRHGGRAARRGLTFWSESGERSVRSPSRVTARGEGPRRAPHVASSPVSRILCRPEGPAAAIYLGPPLPVGLVRPTRDVTGGPPCPCLALLPVGFAEPPRSPAALVVSYTTVSPLPVPGGHRRSALCCTFRRVSPPGRYPAPCPVESGLSSAPLAPRPPGELPLRMQPNAGFCKSRHRSVRPRASTPATVPIVRAMTAPARRVAVEGSWAAASEMMATAA